MKKLKQIIIIPVLFIALSCGESKEMLKSIDLDDVTLISNDNILETNIDDQLVLKVNVESLKDGLHYLDTPVGNKFIVKMTKGSPHEVYITGRGGKVLKGITLLGDMVLEFSCGGFGCVCRGDKDCNDMFSTNVCGRFAICLGEPPTCYCER